MRANLAQIPCLRCLVAFAYAGLMVPALRVGQQLFPWAQDILCRKPSAPFKKGNCPESFDSASEVQVAQACSTFASIMNAAMNESAGESPFEPSSPFRGLQTSMLKDAVVFEITGSLRKYAGNADVEGPCFEAMELALRANGVAQQNAGNFGIQSLLINYIRRNIDNRDILNKDPKLLGLFSDFCDECVDHGLQAGSLELMVDVARNHIDDEGITGEILNGLNMVHHLNSTARYKLYQLGLPQVGLEIMKQYPTNHPGVWANVRQQVVAVITGLCQNLPNETTSKEQREIWQTVMQSYPAEVLKLMREEPTDPPSNTKSLEFMRAMSNNDAKYLQTFLDMGALDQINWAMGNYTTPVASLSGIPVAGRFWNVDLAGALFLRDMASAGHGSELLKHGLTEVLEKAADNPEGGYGTEHYAARLPACNVLDPTMHVPNYPSCLKLYSSM